ncbi:MAG: 3-phosphoserine/phosphohydroxythreonine transaminase [Spirochaetales bacterium]|uniref:Phosphoserine aminotransferase n=1 Tax=Candidatus Thalassospirochaeta sargassi TaxID=3119039 RepID=A0AAJ1MMJ6_9SPIO|nr:3-phosphoserine/phosphohydroxythreonine transaminase [Spirochaetales bacterium]
MRKYNFYAGPSTLPVEVLEELKENMVDYKGMGMSLIETSHRSKEYDEVHNDAVGLVKELLGLPDNYKVMFLGGGATLQFTMVPTNLMIGSRTADYTITGSWAKKAYSDAAKLGNAVAVYDGKDNKYTELPSEVRLSEGSSYLHITSNETIGGLQWQEWPETGDVPLVADMSSDILSRPLPVEKFGLIYAGAQKNLGPAGTTLVIAREDLLERSAANNPTAYLDYSIHADKNSLYNTPPVFSIYAVMLVLKRLKALGGLYAVEKVNREKAGLIYDVIDSSNGFYNCPVQKENRSMMNIVFTMENEDLEKDFVLKATEAGMVGLKGHRSVGGCRASVYNSMPIEGAKALADFMKDFAAGK